MVSKTPRSTPAKIVTAEAAPVAMATTRRSERKPELGTALGVVLIAVAAGAAWFGWQQWQYGEQFPAPVVRDGVVVFDGFGGDAQDELLREIGTSSTQVTVVEEATPVTDSGETLPTSATIVALPVSPTAGVVAAGEMLAPVTPLVVQAFSPRAELASQLGLLISAAKANLTSTPELAKALIPWAEQAGDTGLVALLTPLSNQPVVVEEAKHEGPAWLQRWVVVKKKPVNAYAPDPVVLETLMKYYIEHYVNPAASGSGASSVPVVI